MDIFNWPINSLDQEQNGAMSNPLRNGEADGRSHGSASQVSSTSDNASKVGLVGDKAEPLVTGGGELTGEGGVCEHCGDPLSVAEPVVNYEGRLWHPSCFV